MDKIKVYSAHEASPFIRLNAMRQTLIPVMFFLLYLCVPALADETKQGKWEDCDPGQIQTQPVPDPVSRRSYDVEVSLPLGYDPDGSKRYPVVYLADGDRGTRPVACQIKALREKGDLAEEPIIIGLSYAKGEDQKVSRKRDYTPVPRNPGDTAYGGALAYQRYLRQTVIPAVERLYRVDPNRRIYLGHSYGGLLGTHILLTEPDLFHTYILGSPSFWFANHAILAFEDAYSKAHKDLKADVLFFVGGDEISRFDPDRGSNTKDMVGDMRLFVSRLEQRNFPSLTVRSIVIPGKNHRGAFPPGLTWAITAVLGATPLQ